MDHFYERLFRLRGCFYAADGGAAAGGTPDTPAEAKVSEPEKSENKEPTFDDVLNNKAYRSEYDKRMKAAISDERKKWETAAKAKADEAEKLAKMSEEEKAKHEREQAEKALADREAAVLKRELEAEAKLQLSEKGLPPELSSLLSYADAESCKSSMETVVKAFGEAVEKKTNERLRGTPPKKGASNSTGDPFLAGLGIKTK